MSAERLSSEDVYALTLDAALHRPSKLQSPEAQKMRAALDADVAKIEARGGSVQIPVEHPDLDD